MQTAAFFGRYSQFIIVEEDFLGTKNYKKYFVR